MAWTRFSLAGAAGATLDADAVRYGPGLPPESELRLLGHVDGRRVLDLGCGAGSGAVALAKAGARVIAVDDDEASLSDTRERAEREGVRVETHHGPLAELAFVRADTIDVAVSVYGLATVADLDRVFRQVHRVLRTERPFVFSLPHPAFVLLDPGGAEPVLRRSWWDASPVTWSVGAGRDEPDRVVTLTGLFGSLNRAGFGVDMLLEPQPEQATAGEAWSDAMRWVPPTLIVRARKLGI
ncbi:MAG TPA: class I SAM-dependent methyltransferase [Acidimicrobiales bacterium]|nr:class I SAM-dependent methyltransferase [Acidimicrobiales bacterium]